MTKLVFQLGLAVALAGASTAQTLLLPSAAVGADLSSTSGWPFDYGSPMRILYVYDSSHFTSAGVNAPILINRIRLRANGNTNTTWAGDTVASVTVDLSTSPLDFNSISTTYDSNHGADRAQVYNAPLVIAGGSSTTAAPGPFHVDIPLTQFLYDPNAGDLTIDIVSSGVPAIANTPLLDTSSTTGQALAKRVYGLSYAGSATGSLWSGETSYAIEFSYTPSAGVFAAFTATPLSGPSPLLVQFTDQSSTSDPGGIQTWAWDFDNNGTVDSTLRNPSHQYGCGNFAVRLTVTAANGNDSELKLDYVVTDEISAAFTYSLLAPGTWQFTDTSTPPATAWSWDFNGDNVPDSTVQNPSWPFPAGCAAQTVRLVATRNCKSDSVTEQIVTAPFRLDANLAGGTGTLSSTDVGNFFDIAVTSPEGVSVCALNGLSYTGVGPYTVSVYVTDGTYVGKDTNAAAWRLVATGNAVMGGGTTTMPSVNLCVLNAPFYLPAGNYGIAIYHNAAMGSAYIGYTNTALGPYANADLAIHPNPAVAPGISRQALFGGGTFSPRQWNGSFFYGKCSVSGDAGYGFFGPGCAGSQPVAGNVATALPRLGTTMTVAVDRLPASAMFFVLGFSNTASVFGPLPINLGAFGAPGCFGRVSTDATSFVLGASGTATFALAIPNATSLLCLRIYTQALAVDPGFNALGAVVSDAAGGIIGR